MNPPVVRPHQRDLLLFRDPRRWACWPLLPVVGASPDGSGKQLGVLYDALGTCGPYGFSATVFLANLFLLPLAEEQLFALPRLVYDTADEIAAAGWTVD